MSIKTHGKPKKCPHCDEWLVTPEQAKQQKRKMRKFLFIWTTVFMCIVFGVVFIPSLIDNISYPRADFKADMKFSDFSLDENNTGSEYCNITFTATGGYHYSDFNDLFIRVNFPDFCHIEVVNIYPETVDYAHEGWYGSKGMHHIDYSTISFNFDPHFDGFEYCIDLKITWDYYDVRYGKYESSLNHHDYRPYVLPDRYETFNHLTDFILNGWGPDEYRFNMYTDEEQVYWNPIWEGRDFSE